MALLVCVIPRPIQIFRISPEQINKKEKGRWKGDKLSINTLRSHRHSTQFSVLIPKTHNLKFLRYSFDDFYLNSSFYTSLD